MGLGYLNEHLLGLLLVVEVPIRMPLETELSERLVDVGLGRTSGHAEDLVRIPLLHFPEGVELPSVHARGKEPEEDPEHNGEDDDDASHGSAGRVALVGAGVGVLAGGVGLADAVVAVALKAVGAPALLLVEGVLLVGPAAADGKVGEKDGQKNKEPSEKDDGGLVIELFLLGHYYMCFFIICLFFLICMRIFFPLTMTFFWFFSGFELS